MTAFVFVIAHKGFSSLVELSASYSFWEFDVHDRHVTLQCA